MLSKQNGSSFLPFASLLLHGVMCRAVQVFVAPCGILSCVSPLLVQSINRSRMWALVLLLQLLSISLLVTNYCSLGKVLACVLRCFHLCALKVIM